MNDIKKAVVTVLGIDSKGIIARVSAILFKHDANILDISQTVLADYFNMVLVADITTSPFEALSSELTALGVPAIIVPSPNVANNHQEHNARVLADVGGAEMILEKDCSGKLLYETACAILGDEKRRSAMGAAMSSLGTIDAPEKIYSAVMALCKKR